MRKSVQNIKKKKWHYKINFFVQVNDVNLMHSILYKPPFFFSILFFFCSSFYKMEYSRKCMSIDAIVDNHSTLPPSPPSSCSSRSPSPDYCGKQPHPPMSAEERRYRNKLASAKYRAKKQASMKSMSTKVSQLMTTNHQLSRELAKMKQENEILRAMYERAITQQQPQMYSLPPIHLNH